MHTHARLGAVITALLALLAACAVLSVPAATAATVKPRATFATSYDNPLDAPAAHAGEVRGTPDTSPYLGKWTGYRPSYWVVGDSITAGGLASLRALGATWEVTSIPGRDVSTLPYYVAERMKHETPPTMVVIALGTNASPGWYQADYQAAVDLLPASTRVVFTTTYRDPKLWPNTLDYRRRASIQPHYSQFMHHIDVSRPNTCINEWRGYIEPRYNLLRDGVHPTTDRGYPAWAKRVVSAVHLCAARPMQYARR